MYIIIFIVAIIGLSFIQYKYFQIGLNLAGIQFNQKIGETVKEIKEDLFQRNELTYLVGTAIAKEDLNFKLSLDSLQDASIYFMDDFLRQKLLQKGVKIDFSFNLYGQDSTLYMQSKKVFSDNEKLLKYPVVLEGYLPDLMKSRVVLELQFQNVNRYFLSQLNGLTIPSIIFIVMIIVVILWVYRAFYLQNNLITTTNDFINNLTHELKTPVFAIGVATKILEEKSNEDQKPLISLIRAQVDKLKTQIDKVLEIGVIEEKKGFVKHEKLDIKPILSNIAANFKQQAALNNFTFNSRIQGDSLMILGDAYHIENAINSLLENASKYSEDHADISFSAFTEGKYLVIEVADKGIGIGSQDLNKIFDKYYRISVGDVHTVKGYGLGLHYVKRIVHLHKGSIEVQSKLNEGSTFIIKLPLL
ncbi:HAMP domain-containing sensor histidine kinase [Lutimonas vermicola]|uniref:histidine kinase n=1 Tax=Lutimonas vermicola TaxID=414288 RepID=A0ABU9L0Y8_9FLAO